MYMPRLIRPTEDFGPRLIQLRKARGWTQSQLAQKIDSSIRAIFYYEREGRYPPAPVIAQLADAFDVSIDTLMGRSEAPKQKDPKTLDLLNDPEDRKLWKKFQQLKSLSKRDKQTIFRMLNTMITAKGYSPES